MADPNPAPEAPSHRPSSRSGRPTTIPSRHSHRGRSRRCSAQPGTTRRASATGPARPASACSAPSTGRSAAPACPDWCNRARPGSSAVCTPVPPSSGASAGRTGSPASCSWESRSRSAGATSPAVPAWTGRAGRRPPPSSPAPRRSSPKVRHTEAPEPRSNRCQVVTGPCLGRRTARHLQPMHRRYSPGKDRSCRRCTPQRRQPRLP